MKTLELQNANHDHLSIQIVDVKHNPMYDYKKKHRHDYFEFILFEKGGEGSQLIDFVEYPISGKALDIVMPNQVHLLKRFNEDNGIILQFTKEFLHSSLLLSHIDFTSSLRMNPHTKLTSENFDTLFDSFKKLKRLYNSDKKFKTQQLRHLFAYVFYQVLDVLPKKSEAMVRDNLINQFIDLVECNFKVNRTVAFYANKLNVSLSKLNTELKEKVGKTPLQVIHGLLILEIKRLLMIEQLTHKEISYRLNFDSQSSYSRFVLKNLGCKPSELKEQLQNILQ